MLVKYKIPTQEQFDTVINNFELVLKTCSVAQVNMMQGSIKDCGSPMCHGGWYAFICGLTRKGYNDFSDGANLMAEHLGFEDSDELKGWADEHPELWGNKYGEDMFCDGSAFGGNDDTINRLDQIVDHWKEVKVRCLGHE